MATRYLEILSRDRPYPIGVDESDRTMFSMNVYAMSEVGSRWEEDIVKVLSDASLATLGTDAFVGPGAVIPVGDGPYISVLATGGAESLETHNGTIYERPTAQIVVRARTYSAARTRALAVWRELDGQREASITS